MTIPIVTFYEGDFGRTKIVGSFKIPIVKPDYMKQRRLYLDWKREEAARATIQKALADLSEAVWVLEGRLDEVKIS